MRRKLRRRNKHITDKSSVDNRTLNFIYGNALTRTLASAVMKRWILRALTKYYDSPLSKIHIRKFARKRSIERTRKYHSFNDFFTRGDDFIEFNHDVKTLCSPVEASLTIFDHPDEFFNIKGEKHTIKTLLGGETYGFDDPVFCMFHLSSAHCHRAYAFDSGTIVFEKQIKGKYNPTNPAVDLRGKNPLCTNFRVVHLFETEHFGKACVVQIGSMLVSSVMKYTELNERIERGNRYGAFKLGGSAIVLLFEKKNLDLSEAKLNEVIEINIGDSLNIKSII